MKIATIVLLILALTSLFVVGCTTTSNSIDQPSSADEAVSGEIDDFAEDDFILQDEPVELGELI